MNYFTDALNNVIVDCAPEAQYLYNSTGGNLYCQCMRGYDGNGTSCKGISIHTTALFPPPCSRKKLSREDMPLGGSLNVLYTYLLSLLYHIVFYYIVLWQEEQ